MKLLNKFLSRFIIRLHADGDGGGGGGGGGTGAGGAGGAGGGGAGAGGDAGGGGGGTQAFDIRQHTSDDGSFKADWWKAAGVDEEYGKKFTRPEAALRAGYNAQKLVGAKGIIPPGPNATQADKDAFYKALGRPDKPEEYGFAKPDKIKIGDKEVAVPDYAWDKERASKWQADLYAAGLSKEQANFVMQKAVEESLVGMDRINGAAAQAQQQAKAQLVKDFGGEEGYKTNMALAAKAAQEFGGDELMKHPGLANDPVMIRALAKMGKAIGESPGKGVRQESGEGGGNMTRAEAKEAGQKLTAQMVKLDRADRQWKNSAEAAKMKAEKARLFGIAFPEG